MREVSTDTKTLLDRLDQPLGLWDRIFGACQEVSEILAKIAESGEPAVIPDLLPLLLDERQEINAGAAKAIHRLVGGMSQSDLTWLDQLMRERSPYLGPGRMRWHRLRPDQLGRLERFQDFAASLLGMASFHVNGYVREEAIKRLAKRSDGLELPFLLLRLNDWVRNVRQTASQAIQSRVGPEYARHFVTNLMLVSRLLQTGRDDHAPFVDQVTALLKRAECLEALIEGLSSSDRLTRRFAFQLATDSESSSRRSILERALKEGDPVIRLSAARRIASAFTGDELLTFLERFSRDRFMPVRREALRTYVSQFPSAALERWQEALLDPHASMREEARYALRKIATIDFVVFYRQALAHNDGLTLPVAISGLGETGAAEEATVIRQYVTRGTVKVRRAAIRALAKLDGDAHVEIFVAGLSDSALSISGEAKKALTRRSHLIGGERLWEIFKNATEHHLKLKALFLIAQLGKWESISFLIRAAGDTDSETAGVARNYVGRWYGIYNRQFSQPTKMQLAKIAQALEECGDQLGEGLRNELLFLMKTRER